MVGTKIEPIEETIVTKQETDEMILGIGKFKC